MGAAPTLRMTMLKVKFWTGSEEFGCSAQGFNALIDTGLVQVLGDAMVGDGASLELWLRTMVLEVWMGYLKVPTPSPELHKKLEILGKDADGGCEVLRLNCDQSVVGTRVIAPVLADLEALAAMTLAWKTDSVLAGDVKSAIDRFKEKRLECIAELLPKCDLGREMLSSSAFVIQKSSQTAVADACFARAQSLLSQERWPHIRTDGDLHILVNRQMVADLSVFEVLGEALDLIDQAIEQWSRLDMSTNAETIVGCIAQATEHLHTVEECLALDMELLLAESGIAEVVLDVASKSPEWDAEAAASVFQAACEAFRGVSPQSKLLSEFIEERFLQWLRKLPHDILSEEQYKDTITEQVDPILASEAARTQLGGVYRLMSEVLSNPDMSAGSFYAEIQASASAADIANTRLSKAVKLQQEIVLLKGAAPIQFRGCGCFYEIAVSAEGGEAPALAEHPGIAQSLLDAAQTMHALVLVEATVADSLYLMFTDIARLTGLAGLKVPASALQGGAPSKDLLEACMECTALYAEPIDLVIKNDCDDDLWPGVTLVKIACEIVDMFAALGGRSVGVAPLLTLTTQTTVSTVSDHIFLKHVLHIFEAAGKVGCMLAWLNRKCFAAGAAKIVQKGKINADVEQVLALLQHQISEALNLSEGEAPAGGSSVEIVPWTFPVDKFAHWVSSAQVAYRRLCADVMAAVVKDLQSCAVELQGVVPSYESYFSPTLKLEAAAKLLVQWPSKKALGAGCIALESAIKDASKAFTTWGMEGTLSSDPQFADQMDEVEATYRKAKSALMAIAGVNCIVNTPKEKRRALRDMVVKQHEFLPQTLLQHLRRIQ